MLGLVGSVGFGLRSTLVWDKGRGSRPMKNGFRSQSEMILWARKSGTLDRDGPDVYLDGVFKATTMTGNNKQHLTQKPLSLMRELIAIVPPSKRNRPSVVLDPFHGAGTTGVAALEAGHQYVGIEAVPEYHAIAVERLTSLQTTA